MSVRTPDRRGDLPARTNAAEAFARADGLEKLQLKIGGMSSRLRSKTPGWS